MLACVDVHYAIDTATAACVLFDAWTDEEPLRSIVRVLGRPAPYVPGQFYLRELPCLLAVVEPLRAELTTVVIDGYAWLTPATPGLGARLFDALGRTTPVVGVAKTGFRGAASAVQVFRGTSDKPLFVTAAGLPFEIAAELVRSMHGPHRIPTLLRCVDRLARGSEARVARGKGIA
jgi:deoxyribonuclease V